jgi:hypothetical protein
MRDRLKNHEITIKNKNNKILRGNIQDGKGYFDSTEDIDKGDIFCVNIPAYKEDFVITKVVPFIQNTPGDHIKIEFESVSEYKQKIMSDKNTIQNFNAPVGNVAGRDINQNVSINVIIEAIEKTIQENRGIPEAEKKGLLQKLREIKNNPYVASITSGLLVEAIKNLSNLN